MLKRGSLVDLTISRMDYPNRGRYETEEGQKITVKNALPGQRVEARIFKKHQERLEGKLLRVLAPSPLETKNPACELFPECGGCLYQTLPYEEQLRLKADQVRRLLAEVSSPETVFDGILRSPSAFAYRNKMEFSFGDDRPDGPVNLGLHRRGTTYDVLDASSCRLVHPDLTKILAATQDYCRQMGFPKYNKKIHVGVLRYLLLRRSETNGEILAYLVTSGQTDHTFDAWAKKLLSLPLEGTFAGIFHGIDDAKADALIVERTRGAEVLYEAARSYVLGSAPEGGLFADKKTANVLSLTAVEEGGGADRTAAVRLPVLYDLYSGTGTIGQMLSPAASHVYGIELIEEAVEAANRNAAENGLTNCTFLAGDVLARLGDLPEKPDYIVLDPPREGVNPKALARMIDYGLGEMVYISCKASSFVRDMTTLRAHGWQIRRWCLVDMFPQTQHCETVVQLSRGNVS